MAEIRHTRPEHIIDIPPNLKNSLGRLFATHPEVAKVIVFGSRARGDATERSDIDLAIVAPNATSRQWLDVVFALEDMDTLSSIDAVRWAEASSALKARIIAEGKVLYERRGESKGRMNITGLHFLIWAMTRRRCNRVYTCLLIK